MTFFLEVLCSHFKGGLFLRGKNALEISILRKSFFFQEKVIQHSKRIFIKVKPPVVIFSIDEIFDFFFGGSLLPFLKENKWSKVPPKKKSKISSILKITTGGFTLIKILLECCITFS